MRRNYNFVLKLILLFICVNFIYPQQESKAKDYHDWWHDENVGQELNRPDEKKLPLIKVEGNRFVNEKGDSILFRGLSISDPDKIENQGQWSKSHFEKVKEMGAMIIRIPVHPIAWRERTPAKYIELLDQAVEWCTELGIHIIIDWHSIGNLKMELFQNPMYNTTPGETYEFWRTMARHFNGNNTVAFYEIFNEPTLYHGQLGSMSWDEWKEINEEIINLIRAYDQETIPLVAGFDWAYELYHLQLNPVNAEGIGYVTHPYPHKRTKPYEPKWEENFGFAANKYPVIATEIGFTIGSESIEENGEYGEAIIKYLEGKNISWICWIFDPEWYPQLFESWDTYKLTDGGKFFKEAMHEKITNKK